MGRPGDLSFSLIILGRRLERIDFTCLSIKEKEQVRRPRRHEGGHGRPVWFARNGGVGPVAACTAVAHLRTTTSAARPGSGRGCPSCLVGVGHSNKRQQSARQCRRVDTPRGSHHAGACRQERPRRCPATLLCPVWYARPRARVADRAVRIVLAKPAKSCASAPRPCTHGGAVLPDDHETKFLVGADDGMYYCSREQPGAPRMHLRQRARGVQGGPRETHRERGRRERLCQSAASTQAKAPCPSPRYYKPNGCKRLSSYPKIG